jgi:HD-GYP domain-containing protein (c-di-GMP phosphodiesterase class II)
MFAIDREVLARPGALEPDEWNEVRRHPVLGAQMASVMHGLDKAAVVTILEHHMRYDSSGYPARPLARRQHIMSRIVAVADAYDAMTSQRSYSAPRVPDQAMAVLAQEAGSGLDPELVRLFMGALGAYPPRSMVRLSTGETAIWWRRRP